MNKLIIQDALTRKTIVLFIQQSIKNYIYCEFEVSGPHDMEAAGGKKSPETAILWEFHLKALEVPPLAHQKFQIQKQIWNFGV